MDLQIKIPVNLKYLKIDVYFSHLNQSESVSIRNSTQKNWFQNISLLILSHKLNSMTYTINVYNMAQNNK